MFLPYCSWLNNWPPNPPSLGVENMVCNYFKDSDIQIQTSQECQFANLSLCWCFKITNV